MVSKPPRRSFWCAKSANGRIMTSRKREQVLVAGRAVGAGCKPYIVAELSANHKGRFEGAVAILEAAARAGADAVKLQTYTADTMTIDHDGPGFRIEGGLWDGRHLFDLYEEAHMPWEWHEPLFKRGWELGLDVFSTPFDESAVDFLEGLNPPAYKIASFELLDLPLIRKAASTGKPLIISTGMASEQEIAEAVQAADEGGAGGVILLHCTSAYPALPSDSNLVNIRHLQGRFGRVVGLSDHTLGTAVPVAAIAVGAALVEKHITMRRSDGGPDAAFSLEPAEFGDMTAACQTAYDALGTQRQGPIASERANLQFRRSIYVVRDIPAGGRLTSDNVRAIRPGFGLPPKYMEKVLGRCAIRDLKRGMPLTWDVLAPERDA